jgi:hypothetical protein
MTNPRDPEGLMPDADVTGGPDPDVSGTGDAMGPDTDRTGGDAADPLADRTDLDAFGSDPDVRFPGTDEDPSMTTADATANATRPEPDEM